MIARVCVLAALLAIVVAIPYSELDEDSKHKLFSAWRKKFNKSYQEPELSSRFSVFKANLPLIDSYNVKSSKLNGAEYGLTKFADLSPEEFKALYLTARISRNPEEAAQRVLDTTHVPTAIPTSFDWNAKGAVTPVKNQGQCGSCWAFSTTETIESAWYLAGHSLIGLSEQQIVDCDQGLGDEGCNGGDTVTAYQYVMNAGGLETENNYPYTAYDDNCTFQKSDVAAKISNWTYVIPPSSHDENVMANVLVAKGPLSICVDALSWQFYFGGIIRGLCGNDLDHCVQLTGYNVENSDIFGVTPYWIIRNSWGTDWGYDGYLYVERFYDLCGVADEVTLPII